MAGRSGSIRDRRRFGIGLGIARSLVSAAPGLRQGARPFLIITHHDFAPLVRALHDEIEQAFTGFDGRYGPHPAAQVLLSGANPIQA